MKKAIGLGIAAIAATASLAIAGGDGEGEKKAKAEAKKDNDTATLERMANTQGGGGTTLSAAPGSGFTIEVGDEFSLNIKNRIQLLWRYSNFDSTEDTHDLSVERARTALKGHVWDRDKTYLVQLDWARDREFDNILLDAWFNWDFWCSEDGLNQIGMRIGQQKPHHGKEFQGSSANLEHTDRSLASRTFSGNRVVSAFVHGTHLEGEKLHWWAGFGNSDPAGASSAQESGSGSANTDNEVNFFFDVHFDPFGDFGDEDFVQGDLDYTEEAKGTIGASLMVGNTRPADLGVITAMGGIRDVETTSINLYTAWKYQGLSFLLEAFIRSDDPEGTLPEADSNGWAVGAGYALQPAEEGASQWGFAVRWSFFDQDDTPILLTDGTAEALGTVPGPPVRGNSGDLNEVQLTATNYYHANAMKSQFSYRWQQADPDVGQKEDNHFIDLFFQWMF